MRGPGGQRRKACAHNQFALPGSSNHGRFAATETELNRFRFHQLQVLSIPGHRGASAHDRQSLDRWDDDDPDRSHGPGAGLDPASPADEGFKAEVGTMPYSISGIMAGLIAILGVIALIVVAMRL